MLKTIGSFHILAFRSNDGNDEIIRYSIDRDVDRSLN